MRMGCLSCGGLAWLLGVLMWGTVRSPRQLQRGLVWSGHCNATLGWCCASHLLRRHWVAVLLSLDRVGCNRAVTLCLSR